jgi:hypothetical protein
MDRKLTKSVQTVPPIAFDALCKGAWKRAQSNSALTGVFPKIAPTRLVAFTCDASQAMNLRQRCGFKRVTVAPFSDAT